MKISERDIAYTTVLTDVAFSSAKAILKKTRGERAYVYRPVESQGETRRAHGQGVRRSRIQRSAKPLLVHLVADRGISADELAEIESLC